MQAVHVSRQEACQEMIFLGARGAHCSDIGGGAYKGQNGGKMQLGAE